MASSVVSAATSAASNGSSGSSFSDRQMQDVMRMYGAGLSPAPAPSSQQQQQQQQQTPLFLTGSALTPPQPLPPPPPPPPQQEDADPSTLLPAGRLSPSRAPSVSSAASGGTAAAAAAAQLLVSTTTVAPPVTWDALQELQRQGRATVFKAGVLLKLSSSSSTGEAFWKRRFVVLAHDAVHAFRDPISVAGPAIGFLALDATSSAAPSDEDPLALDIKTLVRAADPRPDLPAVEYRVWTLKCASPEALASWAAAAKLCISQFRSRRRNRVGQQQQQQQQQHHHAHQSQHQLFSPPLPSSSSVASSSTTLTTPTFRGDAIGASPKVSGTTATSSLISGVEPFQRRISPTSATPTSFTTSSTNPSTPTPSHPTVVIPAALLAQAQDALSLLEKLELQSRATAPRSGSPARTPSPVVSIAGTTRSGDSARRKPSSPAFPLPPHPQHPHDGPGDSPTSSSNPPHRSPVTPPPFRIAGRTSSLAPVAPSVLHAQRMAAMQRAENLADSAQQQQQQQQGSSLPPQPRGSSVAAAWPSPYSSSPVTFDEVATAATSARTSPATPPPPQPQPQVPPHDEAVAYAAPVASPRRDLRFRSVSSPLRDQQPPQQRRPQSPYSVSASGGPSPSSQTPPPLPQGRRSEDGAIASVVVERPLPRRSTDVMRSGGSGGGGGGGAGGSVVELTPYTSRTFEIKQTYRSGGSVSTNSATAGSSTGSSSGGGGARSFLRVFRSAANSGSS
ncbi:hypothetical protein HK405_009560 [Cladochytrium tenue]|nr:hypothetical protein HK405_009560 [Cladochytrium tenue]